MIDRGPQAPVAPTVPPVVIPHTRWPTWPGWLVALVGGVVAITGFVAVALEGQGQLEVTNPQVLVAAMIGGSLMVTFGLVYECVRSIRARRWLPLARYRGPSPLILFLVAFVGANAAVLPFTADALKLIEGGELSDAGSFVILTSTQAALLVVTALFVAWPRALAGAPPFDGGRPGRSILVGIGWGILAWIVANIIAVLVALGLDALGMPPESAITETAVAQLNPFLIAFAFIIFAPLAEEIFFRGVAYAGWRREHGVRRAAIGSAVVFAVIHGSLVALLPIFLLGLWLAWLYERTRSLLAAIVLHATFNGISVALALLDRYDVIQLPP